MIVAAAVVRFLGLERQGVTTIGAVPAGLTLARIPHIPLTPIPNLLGDAAGLALVTFSSMMLTAVRIHKHEVVRVYRLADGSSRGPNDRNEMG
jgi:MFS superfamily sulfate permease-like transporter